MTKSQVLSKHSPKLNYREYLKVRLPVYQAQYPTEAREKIVELIIAQFERISSEEHQKIIKGQMKRQPLNLDKSDKKKKPTPVGTQLADSGNKSKNSANKDMMKNESQFKNIEESYSSQLMQTPKSSKKIIMKSKNDKNQYLKFFDFYYKKLHKQHPKWVSNQITTIIKLLWRKKNMNSKARKSSIDSVRSMRKMSGYQAFKRNQTMREQIPNMVIRQNWNRLPKQSKNYWQKRGNHQINKSMKAKTVIRLKSDMMLEATSQKMKMQQPKMTLSFMSKKM